MGETPDDIKREIEEARSRLGTDLDHLEARVKTSLDWRARFNENPWAWVGGAFAIAFAIGWMTADGPKAGA
jgi:ElaB/YqjD/DUF883 family membrane-anchored ribosome-binding protein